MTAMLPLGGAGGRGLSRLAELGIRGSARGSSGSAKLRTVAWSYLTSQLDYYGGLAHTQLRDPATCSLPGAPPPIRAERVVPDDGYLPGEPEVPRPFARATVSVVDELTISKYAGECPLRRIVVRLFLDAGHVPFVEGFGFKSES